jgi:xylulokinase
LLAGVGAGMWPSADAACDAVVQIAQRVAPQPTDSAKLQDFYAIYRGLYPSLQPVFHQLHAATTEVKANGG